MKKRVLLFTSLAFVGYMSLSSYQLGPATAAGDNLTGSTGGSATCNTGGCHANNSTATTDTLYLIDKATGLAVNEYVPGTVYTAQLRGTNTSTALTHFGFQVSAVLSTGSQGGTFAVTSGNTHIKTLSGHQVVEHNGSIAGTGNKYLTSFNWTAPAKGNGSVTFYGILNAVNNNGSSDNGDIPNPASPLTITENTTAIVTSVLDNVGINAYPNPVSTQLTMEIIGASGNYALNAYDLSGKKVMSAQTFISGATQKTIINTSNWNAGIYILQVVKDGAAKSLQIVKQ